MKFRVCLLGLAFVGASIVGTSTSANGNLYFSLNPCCEFDTFLVQTGTSKRLQIDIPAIKHSIRLCRNRDIDLNLLQPRKFVFGERIAFRCDRSSSNQPINTRTSELAPSMKLAARKLYDMMLVIADVISAHCDYDARTLHPRVPD